MKTENRGGETTSPYFTHFRCKCGNIFEEKYGKYGCCDTAAKPILSTNKHGGVRVAGEGKKIGAPKKEPTATIAFRVPANRKVEFQKLFREYLAFLLNGA